MTNKLKFKATTKCGLVAKWTFIEEKKSNYFGEPIYIYAKTSCSRSCLAVSYENKYDFRKVCVEYLLKFYGQNLDELEEI